MSLSARKKALFPRLNCSSDNDQPTKPQNVVLTEDKITWEKVFRGVNGGYLDIDNLTYHIYLNGEEIGTTKNLEYPIDILSGSMPFTGYVATVAADNRNVISELSEESDMLQTGSPWALDVHIALPAPNPRLLPQLILTETKATGSTSIRTLITAM